MLQRCTFRLCRRFVTTSPTLAIMLSPPPSPPALPPLVQLRGSCGATVFLSLFAPLPPWLQYDFPGSNSGIDVHALTGWLPESMRTSDKSFDPDRTWERLLSGSQYGDCLITIATGPLTEAQELEYGLVESHAYVLSHTHAFCRCLAPRHRSHVLLGGAPWECVAAGSSSSSPYPPPLSPPPPTPHPRRVMSLFPPATLCWTCDRWVPCG